MGFIMSCKLIDSLFLALLCVACCQVSLGSEFREMLSFSTPREPVFQGTGGTTSITVYVQYENVSSSAFVIDGLATSVIRAPEAIGLPDLSASWHGLAEMEEVFPAFDLFNSYYWSDDTPEKAWTGVVIVFDENFPLRVEPGESFYYHRVMTNSSGGNAFGPGAYADLVPSVISEATLPTRVGESLVAIDLDWRLVPEPGSVGAVVFILAGLCRPWRQTRR
ncbi:MAG: hypothetical protein KDA37_02230 [Planctomycetales bacterium]|nr:hypothetical protein [Planctomycetales bacterium]